MSILEKQEYSGLCTYGCKKKGMGSGEELEGKFCSGFGTTNHNIGEAEKRTGEGEVVNDCSAPRAGRDWCIEYSVMLSKHTGQEREGPRVRA